MAHTSKRAPGDSQQSKSRRSSTIQLHEHTARCQCRPPVRLRRRAAAPAPAESTWCAAAYERRHGKVRFSQAVETRMDVERERGRVSRIQGYCATRRRASVTAMAADGRDSAPCGQEVVPAFSSHC